MNCICGSMELNCLKNFWLCYAFLDDKVLSIYLSQSLCGLGAVLMALDSNSFMNRLATNGPLGEPRAAPWM